MTAMGGDFELISEIKHFYFFLILVFQIFIYSFVIYCLSFPIYLVNCSQRFMYFHVA